MLAAVPNMAMVVLRCKYVSQQENLNNLLSGNNNQNVTVSKKSDSARQTRPTQGTHSQHMHLGLL